MLRVTPFAASLGITLFIVAPAFTLFEPVHENEPFGPMLALLRVSDFVEMRER